MTTVKKEKKLKKSKKKSKKSKKARKEQKAQTGPRPGQKRVALYSRTSTRDKGQEIGLQTEELERLVEGRNWWLTKSYMDDGVSGAQRSRKNPRPALTEMLADAQAGRFDILAVWRIDRLGRSVLDLTQTINELDSYGVEFVSARDPGLDTTTAHGKLLFHIMASFAEFEREMTRERIIAGVRRAQAAGRPIGRPKVEMDLRPALAMLKEGHGLTTTAKALGVARSTLRRRLMEAGEWAPGAPLIPYRSQAKKE